MPLTNNSTIAGLDQGLIDYARIHARGAVKDMVPRRPGIKNPRPLLYWAIHPPENCAMMLLQRTPALAKLIATTPGVDNMHDLAVLLADPVQQSAKQEKYVYLFFVVCFFCLPFLHCLLFTETLRYASSGTFS